TFCFDVEEISSGTTTTHPDLSLLEYEAFYDDHVKEISSGSPTTPSDISLSEYDSFMFDLSVNPFPPADRSDSYEFTDELIPFISAPEYDCFRFTVEPHSQDFTKDVVETISLTKEPQQYLDELKRLSNLEYRDEVKIAEFTQNFNDEFIKSGVENLISIPSESEGIPEHVCDVPFHDNSPPLDVSKDQIEDFSESNEKFSSIDDDSFSLDDIDYVEASPPNSEPVSSEVMEIVIPEVGGIDDDILLTITDDILHEKLSNVNLLIYIIEALNANPTPSSDCKTKSPIHFSQLSLGGDSYL
nr:hypothetical protein [Tanacetum cinerariifolium]